MKMENFTTNLRNKEIKAMEGKKSFLMCVGVFLLGMFVLTLCGCAVTNETTVKTNSSEYNAAVGFGIKCEK